MQINSARPLYQLRLYTSPCMEIWQMPASATPQIAKPLRIARLAGTPLTLARPRIAEALKKAAIADSYQEEQVFDLDEDLAIDLSLLARTLNPMRNPERIRQIMTALDDMPSQEKSYWLGMAMYRPHPGRALSALRILLTSPAPRRKK